VIGVTRSVVPRVKTAWYPLYEILDGPQRQNDEVAERNIYVPAKNKLSIIL
jgi:hypothetical protein